MQSINEQPVFPNDASYFFEVTTLESFLSDPNNADKPVRSPHHRIVWVNKGSGYCCVDLEEYQVMDNTIYIIPPHRYVQFPPKQLLAGFVLSFNGDFLQLAIEGPGRPFFKEITHDLNRVNVLSLKAESRSLQSLLDDMAQEFKLHLILRLEILTGLFKIFLIYMKRLARMVQQEYTSSHQMRLFNSFCSVLEKNFRTRRQVAEYASELSVTPNYLSDVVKKVTGRTASYHIQQRMVLEAKRLALYNDANMKATAYTLGFEDPSHFSKFFKMAAGLNFSEFKKKTFVRHIN